MAYVKFTNKNAGGDGESGDMLVNAEGCEVAYMGNIAPGEDFGTAYSWLNQPDYQTFTVVHPGGTQTYLYFTGGEWDETAGDFVNYIFSLFDTARVQGANTGVAATYVEQVEVIGGADTNVTCDGIVPNCAPKASAYP